MDSLHCEYALWDPLLKKKRSVVTAASLWVLLGACSPNPVKRSNDALTTVSIAPPKDNSEATTTVATSPVTGKVPFREPRELLGRWELVNPVGGSGARLDSHVGFDGSLWMSTNHDEGCSEFAGSFRVANGVLILEKKLSDRQDPVADSSSAGVLCDENVVDPRVRPMTDLLQVRPRIERSGDTLRISGTGNTSMAYVFQYQGPVPYSLSPD
jgi:hypothetical protein